MDRRAVPGSLGAGGSSQQAEEKGYAEIDEHYTGCYMTT
jgi:hypothetical protein